MVHTLIDMSGLTTWIAILGTFLIFWELRRKPVENQELEAEKQAVDEILGMMRLARWISLLLSVLACLLITCQEWEMCLQGYAELGEMFGHRSGLWFLLCVLYLIFSCAVPRRNQYPAVMRKLCVAAFWMGVFFLVFYALLANPAAV